MRWTHTLAAIALLAGAAHSAAQSSEGEARALIKAYIELHNSHDLGATMGLYAEDAVFFLSMGRPAVHGRERIGALERFDVAAGSTLYPQRLTVVEDGARWRVHIGGVIEHSRIFAAAGVPIVMAQPVRDGFVLEGGRIVELRQPELEPACTATIVSAFGGMAAWLVERDDERRARLTVDGRVNLTPATIPEIVQVLYEWRAETGWSPPRSAVSACARFDP